MIAPSLQEKIDRIEAQRTERLELALLHAREVFERFKPGKTQPVGFGSFARATLDWARLERAISAKQPTQNYAAQLERLQELATQLPGLKWQAWEAPAALARSFAQWMEPFEELVALLRLSNELRHGGRAELSPCPWSSFSAAELALCPPFMLDASTAPLGELLEALSLGLPLKLLRHRRLEDLFSPRQEREAALHPQAEPSWLAVQMRRVFVLSGTLGMGLEHLEAALDSGRSALWDVVEVPENLERLALASKTLLPLRFDPDHRGGHPSGIVPLGPEPTPDWAQTTEEGLDAQGEALTREGPLTPADLYAKLPGQDQSLRALEPDEPSLALVDFLNQAPTQRAGKTPYIETRQANLRWQRKAVPPWLVFYCQDCYERAAQFAALQAPLREPTVPRPQPAAAPPGPNPDEAVRAAMARLSAKLLGLEPSQLDDLAQSVTQPSSAAPSPTAQATEAPAAAPQASPVSDGLPWIETERCTSCDECTKINKKIFAYNDQKQAYIKNPTGGPFKDIVKAAEKCSATIIHPGQPQNPQEKDLEKWIARAEKYQ